MAVLGLFYQLSQLSLMGKTDLLLQYRYMT